MSNDVKTKLNDGSVLDFLHSIDHPKRREDGLDMLKVMEDVTGLDGKMWGKSIVGFGSYHYVYKSGREGDWMMVGFSPRKQNLTLYIMPGFTKYRELLSTLGNHKIGKSCLYINSLEEVDQKVLVQIIKSSFDLMKKKYG